MQEQPNEQMRKWDAMEREALYLLTDPDCYLPIWSIADLGREIEYSDRRPSSGRCATRALSTAPATASYSPRQLLGTSHSPESCRTR
jgi:hypothetical protein